LGWGASTVFGRKLALAGFSPFSLLAGRFFVALIAISFFVPWSDSIVLDDQVDYLRIFIMVILSGALAMWLYYVGIHRLPAKIATLLEMFFPLMAVGVNWFFLGKQLEEIQLLGGALLMLGSFVLQVRKY
jgi:drug/metabolite transporter (DMT)-like permease